MRCQVGIRQFVKDLYSGIPVTLSSLASEEESCRPPGNLMSSTANETSLAWKLILDESCTSSSGVETDSQKERVIQLKGIFLSLDSDQDGLLSVAQLEGALSRIGLKIGSSVLASLGSHVNFETFRGIVSEQTRRLKQVEEELDELFAFLDDGDGFIAVDRLRRLLGKEDGTEQQFADLLGVLSHTTEKTISIEVLKSKILFGT
ncbi:hypothetical protein B484DRAFT_448545 [Ochromonadaceae sp. CCMP2298]|nr:hypothetical protein B484DRAFT_448545 [Ochromonadaceae sp. CCMP2298]|mmetsp:Transcript_16882/g.37489  ORF Transcript_16882/g.37489 Transcript_16882/m.37489 type:complete len:204 (+) Transcript_16882:3-614(+)